MCFPILRTGSRFRGVWATKPVQRIWRAYYENPRVLGLVEMMNAPGTVKAEEGSG